MNAAPCVKCGKDYFVFHGGDPGKVTCDDCYVPSNPTSGWMLAKYRSRGLPEADLRECMRLHAGRGGQSSIDKFLQRALGITPVTKAIGADAEVQR